MLLEREKTERELSRLRDRSPGKKRRWAGRSDDEQDTPGDEGG